MKAEHVNAIVRFIRRMKPVDLLLPVGAALVSAGIQNLVDREDRQRRRLAALDELVGMHRNGLAAAGVDLSDPVWADETHPLDIESALQIVLARTPSEEPAADEPRPAPRRGRKTLAVLGIAGAAGVTYWGRTYARMNGHEPTLVGLLSALRGPDPVELVDPPAPDPVPGVCEFCGHDHDPQTSPHPAGPPADDEVVIGKGEPPLEHCGWPGCDWSSDATRSAMGQQTQGALHRNKCVHRPAGAGV